jgi:hypothetical protein
MIKPTSFPSFLLACALCAGAAGLLHAQDVNSVTPAAAPSPQAAAPAPSKPSSAQSEAGEPRAATSSAAGKTGAPKRGRNASDRVDLDTTTVTGNRELPKVMYVVPWKRSDIGDLIGRPANSLLDEVLSPVDRSVFRREVQYYQALKPDTAAPPAAAAPAAPQVEK